MLPQATTIDDEKGEWKQCMRRGHEHTYSSNLLQGAPVSKRPLAPDVAWINRRIRDGRVGAWEDGRMGRGDGRTA